MRALLIIDMQLGSFRPYTMRHEALDVVDRINELSGMFSRNGDKVIFIQHDGTEENSFIPGTEDWEILPELTRRTGDVVVSKTANDSFYKTNLHEILSKHHITDLFITGCATDFCVDTTIKSALTKEYLVTVVEDAHTTASRPFIDAPTVIKHYNWLWADMAPAKHKIKVQTTREIVDSLTPLR